MPQKGGTEGSCTHEVATRDTKYMDYEIASGKIMRPITSNLESEIEPSNEPAYSSDDPAGATEPQSEEKRKDPKYYRNSTKGTAGLPNSRKGHGDGGSIVGGTQTPKVRQFNTRARTYAATSGVGT